MKDLIYSLASLIIGIVIGILTVISALAVFFLWIATDEKKKPRTSKSYKDYLASRRSSYDEFLASHGQKEETPDVGSTSI